MYTFDFKQYDDPEKYSDIYRSLNKSRKFQRMLIGIYSNVCENNDN